MTKNRSRIVSLLLIAAISILFFLTLYFFISINRIPFQGTLESIKKTLVARVKNSFNKPLCPGCNVILISLDTLNPDNLPCYGYERNTAPQLCSYIKDNIQFTRAYANATFTLPSHVSIFTGLLPSKHGVNKLARDGLKKDIPFLPEILQQNGYATYFAFPLDSDYFPLKTVYNRGITKMYGAYEPGEWDNALKQFAANTAQGKKTFLFLHTYFVHAPYLLHDEDTMYVEKEFPNIPLTWNKYNECTQEFVNYFRKTLKQDIKDGFWGDRTPLYSQYLQDVENHWSDLPYVCGVARKIGKYINRYYWSNVNTSDPAQVKELRDLYDQKIYQMDAALKKVIAFVKDQKYKNNTIVIFTSDHGEEFMEHRFMEHVTLYDTNVHVLLAVHVPGMENKTISSLAQSIDIAPTILRLVGIQPSDSFQGNSLIESILGEDGKTTYVVSEDVARGKKTIRDAQFKLFTQTENKKLIPYELYDNLRDPGEKDNILFENLDTASVLLKQLQVIFKKVPVNNP